jgi:hypothetical protein
MHAPLHLNFRAFYLVVIAQGDSDDWSRLECSLHLAREKRLVTKSNLLLLNLSMSTPGALSPLSQAYHIARGHNEQSRDACFYGSRVHVPHQQLKTTTHRTTS